MNPVHTDSNARSRTIRKKGLNVFDILFVLFKHKKKIIFFLFLGMVGAASLIYMNHLSPTYESSAKLLVRYVLERSAVDPYETKADPAGIRGMAVMDAEIEIVKSSDILIEVARKIGPEKIVPISKIPPTDASAAFSISQKLLVSSSRGSNVIHLAYRHSDPAITAAVLQQLIETYFEKHLEIHRSTGAFDSVARQTDKARSQLSQTEAELSKLSAESGFLSLTDAKAALESRRNELRSNLIAANVEFVEQKVRVASLSKALGIVHEISPGAEAEPPLAGDTPEDIDRLKAQQKYIDLAEQQSIFKQRRNTLMMSRKSGYPMLDSLDGQITSIQEQVLELVARYPALANQSEVSGASVPVAPGADLNLERANLDALEAKIKSLEGFLASVDTEMDELSGKSAAFKNLERRRQMEEEKYRYCEVSLEKARVDEALNPASMPNIGVVQSPSAPTKTFPAATVQLGLAIVAAGLAMGLGLAFLSEWVINPRVSRPFEIQTRLQLPLMMAIPWIRSKDGVSGLLECGSDRKRAGNHRDVILQPEMPDGGIHAGVSESDHFIMPYARAIRDRIMFGFEVGNVTHKPKLIGITGLSPGAGTTTLAIATAKSLAEGDKFKVLLVDLNSSWSGILPESLVVPLKTALSSSLSTDFRQHSRGLCFASAPTQVSKKGARSLESVAMHELMPQLGASNYDYILFDMPPVSKTSPTVALAGFMDKVLLVLDAENTDREVLCSSYKELERGGTDVSCVFNRTRNVAPRWVAGEV